MQAIAPLLALDGVDLMNGLDLGLWQLPTSSIVDAGRHSWVAPSRSEFGSSPNAPMRAGRTTEEITGSATSVLTPTIRFNTILRFVISGCRGNAQAAVLMSSANPVR